jgi:hypothetical protein
MCGKAFQSISDLSTMILMLMWVFELHDFPSGLETIHQRICPLRKIITLLYFFYVFISVITLHELPLMCLHGTVYVVLSDEYMKPILRRCSDAKDDVYCPAYMTRICRK